MVIQVLSIYKTVLETDILKQKIASGKGNFSKEDGCDVNPNVSIKKT